MILSVATLKLSKISQEDFLSGVCCSKPGEETFVFFLTLTVPISSKDGNFLGNDSLWDSVFFMDQ